MPESAKAYEFVVIESRPGGISGSGARRSFGKWVMSAKWQYRKWDWIKIDS